MQFDSNGWLDEAVEIDYTNKSESRQGYIPKFLILHGTAGGTSAQNIGNYFATSDVQASAHFVIGVDGTIVQGVPLSLAAWGNGPISGTPADLGFRTAGDGVHRDPWWNPKINPNWLTRASIEHCKPHDDNSDEITPAQKIASFALIKCICDTYDVPKRFADALGGITGHFSMDPVERSRCPGPYPWQELFDYLNGNEEEQPMAIDTTNPVVANYFKASSDGKTWQCKNGNIVGGAILDFYKSFGGSGLCGLSHLGLPLTNEIGVANHPGVTCQRFERGVLVYDPSRVNDNPPGLDTSDQVYTAHIDSGVGQDPRVTSLQALLASSNLGQINTLGKQISDDVALIQKLSQVQ